MRDPLTLRKGQRVRGGSVTDGGKAVTICLEHDVHDMAPGYTKADRTTISS